VEEAKPERGKAAAEGKPEKPGKKAVEEAKPERGKATAEGGQGKPKAHGGEPPSGAPQQE
jgi:hypothetical protein